MTTNPESFPQPRKTPAELMEEQKVVEETDDLSGMFKEGETSEDLKQGPKRTIKDLNPEKPDDEAGVDSLFEKGKTDAPDSEELSDLAKYSEQQETKEGITPEKIQQAWEQLSADEQKFVLKTSDEVFQEVAGKYKGESKKADTIILLRQLIKTNHPLASKIDYAKAA